MAKARQPPDLSGPRLVPALVSIAKSTRGLQAYSLGQLGFFNGQDELLMAANESGSAVTQLAIELAIRPSTVSKMLDRLVSKGLVTRHDGLQDRRHTSVRITPAGIKARTQLLVVRDELEMYLAKDLLPDRLNSIMDSLAECRTILSRKLGRLR